MATHEQNLRVIRDLQKPGSSVLLPDGGSVERLVIGAATQARLRPTVESDLAEVWCSECDQPATGSVDGRSYCERDMGVAVRAVGARRAEADKLVGYLTSSLSRTELYGPRVTEDDVRAAITRVIATTIPTGERWPGYTAGAQAYEESLSNPSPAAQKAAKDAGIPAL